MRVPLTTIKKWSRGGLKMGGGVGSNHHTGVASFGIGDVLQGVISMAFISR